MRFLIVEDDLTSRVVLQEFLDGCGQCHIVVNGVEAVNAVHKALDEGDPYDLICLDIMMPQLDGLATLQTIRSLEETSGVPSTDRAMIVMTTALDDTHHVATAYTRLCDGYLVKPIDRTAIDVFVQACQFRKLAAQHGCTDCEA